MTPPLEKHCPACGTRYAADLAFCTVDGAPLKAAAPSAPVVATPAKAPSRLPWALAGSLAGALAVALALLWAGPRETGGTVTKVEAARYVPTDALPDAVDFPEARRCDWTSDQALALRDAPRLDAAVTGELAAGTPIRTEDVRTVLDTPGQIRVRRAVTMDAVTLGPKLNFEPPDGAFTTLPYRAGESFAFVRAPEQRALYVVGRQFLHSVDANAYASAFEVMAEPRVTRWLRTTGGWVPAGALSADGCR